MDYALHIAILVGIFAILAVSLDLTAGHAGLLSVAHAAFYGVGAYTSALLAVTWQTPFIASVAAAFIGGMLASLLISIPSRRLRGDYLVVASFGLQVIVFGVLNNWIEVTRGPMGIPDIPPVTIGPVLFQGPASYVFLVWACVVATWWICGRLMRSPFGRVLRALREDETLAQALGKDTWRAKVVVLAVSAGMAAGAGAIYAHYTSFIDPSSFTLGESILVFSMVIIGGAGSRWGPIVGALILIVLPEALRFVGLPPAVAANGRQVLYGIGLVLMVLFRPRGMVGNYEFGR